MNREEELEEWEGRVPVLAQEWVNQVHEAGLTVAICERPFSIWMIILCPNQGLEIEERARKRMITRELIDLVPDVSPEWSDRDSLVIDPVNMGIDSADGWGVEKSGVDHVFAELVCALTVTERSVVSERRRKDAEQAQLDRMFDEKVNQEIETDPRMVNLREKTDRLREELRGEKEDLRESFRYVVDEGALGVGGRQL